MSRCHDGVFHRVICVTLLAIAVTFTVILTNVFVDIDAWISSSIAASKHKNAPVTTTRRVEDVTPEVNPPEVFYNYDEGNFDGNDDGFRTKRSLEARTYQRHTKNPKITKLLTHRLATLLEEMDAEYTTSTANYDISTKDKETATHEGSVHSNRDEMDLLRLTVHNILLDGVVNHIDFREIYKEIQAFQQAFKQMYPKKEWKSLHAPIILERTSNGITPAPVPKEQLFKKELLNEVDNENQVLYDELLKCAELKADIKERMAKMSDNVKVNNIDNSKIYASKIGDADGLKKEPKFIINTDIDIETADGKNNTLTKDDFAAIIHVSYNGKPVSINNDTPHFMTDSQIKKDKSVNLTFVHEFLKEYFKMFSLTQKDLPNYSEISQIETKRLKRHIKLRFTDQNDSDKEEHNKYDNTIVKRTGSADDELFVEIKTFFNNNTVKGDKKRKLIETLIKKIENAVYSDLPLNDHKNRKKATFKHWNIKKRLQSPLKQHRFRTNNVPRHITSRQIEAIGKVDEKHNSQEITMNKVPENHGDDYYRVKIDDVNQVGVSNAPKYYENDNYRYVAQRLQMPLSINKDISNETLSDLHKLKFLIKNIDGSGFSIGFNQYSDEPPDPESIKLFTGLDHLIRTYHQQYDQIDEDKGVNYSSYENYYDQNHVVAKRSLDFFTLNKLLPGISDLKEVKIGPSDVDDIFGNEIISLDNYAQHFNDSNKIFNVELANEINKNRLFELVTEKKLRNKSQKFDQFNSQPNITDVFLEKLLKPAEIINLAGTFGRKKRSPEGKNLTLKDIILRQRIKHATGRKIKNKRQVNVIYPSSNQAYLEQYFARIDDHARRAIENINKDEATAPFIRETNIFARRDPLLPPVLYQQNPTFQNYRPTISKATQYPHVFEDTKIQVDENGAEYFPVDPNFKIDLIKDINKKDTAEIDNSEVPDFKDIVGGYSDKNYKITVKVLPKQFHRDGVINETETLGSFKEVHTSINKSFDRAGKRISTSLNISEVSHITDLHNSTTKRPAKASVNKTSSVVNHNIVKKQKLPPQDHVKNILTEHKNIINNQLVHLENQKLKIDDLLGSNSKLMLMLDQKQQEKQNNFGYFALGNATSSDDLARKFDKPDELLDIPLPFQPPKLVRLTKEQIGNILGNSLRAQDSGKIPRYQKAEELKHTSYSDSILYENLSLTHEILRKIVRNTDALEKFLQKLTNDRRISSLLKRASIDSAEIMKNGGNVVNIETTKKITPEPIRVQMLAVDIKPNEAEISKSMLKVTERSTENIITLNSNKTVDEQNLPVKFAPEVKTLDNVKNTTDLKTYLSHINMTTV